MAHEPKRRHSTERKGKRRASIKLSLPSLSSCSNCKSAIMPHTACSICGYYKGQKVASL
ncbi:MAG: 50S ribosomal protein L32 [Candidatus Levybacteria bacterium]|nr:50S ribosomal protein L32 [Candidatus Levybacteria bacterium]